MRLNAFKGDNPDPHKQAMLQWASLLNRAHANKAQVSKAQKPELRHLSVLSNAYPAIRRGFTND